MQLHLNHQIIIDRFISACQADHRVAAALHVGSYVKGLADEHSADGKQPRVVTIEAAPR